MLVAIPHIIMLLPKNPTYATVELYLLLGLRKLTIHHD